jgi:hypothetical protein
MGIVYKYLEMRNTLALDQIMLEFFMDACGIEVGDGGNSLIQDHCK